MSQHLERARYLMERSRFADAEKELRLQIAEQPDDALAHALLALCSSELKKPPRETLSAAHTAIATAPDFPFAHYALAYVQQELAELPAAERAVDEAIRLDPEEPDYFALRASILLGRRRWPEALRAAEQGLELDSEHVGCINLRAMALGKLNRRDEAGAEIGTALGVDPDNPLTHANQGWYEVERGRYEAAMNHFREALRLDPQSEWARDGIVEVLKARNPVYRVMLRYFLWTARLQGRALWVFILAAWIGSRIVRSLINTQPALAPVLWPIYVAYLLFVLLTWISRPLFNLTLRLDPIGRIALTREQIKASNWVGASLLTAIVAGLVGLFAESAFAVALAVFSLLMTMPLSVSLSSTAPVARRRLSIYTVALAVFGCAGLALLAVGSEAAAVPGLLFFLGFFIFQFVANYYAARS